MKIFISSVFKDMEPYRTAAAVAIRSLGHEVVQAEDFPVSSTSPQVACLAGVRAANAVVLLLGERYGPLQVSGMSATHEEYQEAKDRCPIFAFVQSDVPREPDQEAFLGEVQAWSGGHYRGSFKGADDLQSTVIAALHRWELSQAAGQVDPAEMLGRATTLLPDRRQGYSSPMLAIAIVGAPLQSVLRPSELEGQELKDVLLKAAYFGEVPIFTPAERTETTLIQHALLLKQERRSLMIDEQGSVSQRLPLTEGRAGRSFLIEEDVRETLTKALRFATWVLHYIDPIERLSHVAVAVSLVDTNYLGWRTRQEHQASPNGGTVRMAAGDDPIRANLSPAHRSRAALRLEYEKMAVDLVVLLRRAYRR